MDGTGTSQIFVNALIKEAKLGRARKEAQEDTCAEFAAALYDTLKELEIKCSLYVVTISGYIGYPAYHTVVKVQGTYYDSLGVFSEKELRIRLKTHPSVTLTLEYRREPRAGVFEDDMIEMYRFYRKQLTKAAATLRR